MSVQAQILIALRDGDHLFRRPRGESWWIESTDGRRLDVDRREAWLAIDHELIRTDDDKIVAECLQYVATDKGQRVSFWARPDTSLWHLTQEWTPEHVAMLDVIRNKKLARKVFDVLTFNAGRIRGGQVMFVSGSVLQRAYASAYREPFCEAVMALVRPHCEEFTDIDGEPSLRITEAGIAATARKRAR